MEKIIKEGLIMRCYEVTKKPVFPKECESCYANSVCEVWRAYKELLKIYNDLNDKYFALLKIQNVESITDLVKENEKL